MNKTRKHIFVSGQVQGVFFRQETFKKAKKLGLFGWVRNTEDGRMEVVVEGEQDRVGELLYWLEIGPAQAKVEKVEVEKEVYQEEFKDFTIRY